MMSAGSDRDGGAAVEEGVGEALEAAVVLADGHVALEQAMELLLGVHGALEAVVEELAGDRRSRSVGRGAQVVDVAPNVLGHSGVEPGDDVGINLEPLWIIIHGGGINRVIIVVDEAKFLEHELKE